MSFAALETSLQDGKPVRLYQFQRGPLKWGYCSADRDIQHLGITFKAMPGGISDDGIRQTENETGDVLRLTMAADLDLPQMYRYVAPSQTVHLTIFDLHYSDDGYLVVWVGIVVGVKFESDYRAKVECQTLSASLEQTGLRETWTKICPLQLYSERCGVPRNNYRYTGTINAVDAMSVQIAEAASQPSGYFAGGYVEWTGPYGLEQRGIEIHEGQILTLYGGASGLVAAQELTFYAGCDRLFETCQTKFENTPNYGGAPHMPGKSPFDGTPIF